MNVVLIIIAVSVVLYLLAIMPRMVSRPDQTPFHGVLYAHRGLHDNETDAPENSLKAFSKAVDAGYGIELDVQLTRDKVPVVFHDFTLNRVCGVRGKVEDYTYEELQDMSLFRSAEKIPSFEDFLELVKGRVPLIVELKIERMDYSVCHLADGLLKNYPGAYCIESFHPLALLWYRRHQNGVMRGQLSDAFHMKAGMKGFLYFLLQHMLLNFVTKPDFIAYNHKYYRSLSRQICHKLYRSLSVAWTVRSQQELDAGKKEFDLFIFEGFLPDGQK